MYKNGFIKVSAVTPKIVAGDILNNEKEIINILNSNQASIIVFPELTITGYSASDLFYQEDFLKQALKSLKNILSQNKHTGISVIGLPLDINGGLFNIAVVIQGNKILGAIPKYFMPNNQEFSEKRWFISGRDININEITILGQNVPFGNILFKEDNKNIVIGVEICQDMWSIKSPSDDLAMAGANIILNLSASTELINKTTKRRIAVLDHSRKQMSAYVYATTGIYESSSESLFSSHKIIAELGETLNESETIHFDAKSIYADLNITKINFMRRQDSNYRDSIFKNEFSYQTVNFNLLESNDFEFNELVNKTPFIPNEEELKHAYQILVASLVKKLLALPKNLRKLMIGISGGLDSTHALIIAVNAFKKLNLPLSDIYPVIMPAKVSSEQSVLDATNLIEGLGLKPMTVNIEESVKQHLKDLSHSEMDTTYENVQARIRTMVLMNMANKHGGIVLGTGDLSEIALGFMTYNGDQMSMYAINSGLPKTLIQALVKYYAKNEYINIKDILEKIVNKPVSPELLKDQVTEDIIGSYEINDFIMYYHLVNGFNETNLTWLIQKVFELTKEEALEYVVRFIKLFYNQQFKRATLPEGPKVFNFSLSPRNSYKMPSDILRRIDTNEQK